MTLPKPFQDMVELRDILLRQGFNLSRLRPQVIPIDEQPEVYEFIQSTAHYNTLHDWKGHTEGFFMEIPWVFEGVEAALRTEVDMLRSRVAALQAEVDTLKNVRVTVSVDGNN
tara:strand:- start:12417 stop:12755 length:339 start_codon:yes stop_codon:yes gene_type:complete